MPNGEEKEELFSIFLWDILTDFSYVLNLVLSFWVMIFGWMYTIQYNTQRLNYGLSRAYKLIITEQIIHPTLFYKALKYARMIYTFDFIQNTEFSISIFWTWILLNWQEIEVKYFLIRRVNIPEIASRGRTQLLTINYLYSP